MMAESAALSPEEAWLQDSEMRIESMEEMLKSVRRDIDALSEKLPSPETGRIKLSSPVFDDGFVHESGTKQYRLAIDDKSPIKSPCSSTDASKFINSSEREVIHVEHHNAFYNLGFGSHTHSELFETEEDKTPETQEPIIRSEHDLVKATEGDDNNFIKSWRSPADFRQSNSLVTAIDSPPSTPTFGKTDDLISLQNILLHSENVEEDKQITIPFGSSHSLATIEENSEEDRVMTDSENADSSVSADLPNLPLHEDGENLKAGACVKKNQLSSQMVTATCSYESVQACENSSEVVNQNNSQKSLEENMSLLRNRSTRSLVERSFERPRSGDPFMAVNDELPLAKKPQNQSSTSLKSRESMISEAESYVTVHSQPYRSSSFEDAYVTACSDFDGAAENVTPDEEGMNTVRIAPDWVTASALLSRSKERKTRKMVLQPAPSDDSIHQSDDVLEFTLVEEQCSTPTPWEENDCSQQRKTPTAKLYQTASSVLNQENASEDNRRRPPRKRQQERTSLDRESDSEDNGSDSSSSLSSSSADEAEYDATNPYVYSKVGYTEECRLDNEPRMYRPTWNRLSCIEERSWTAEHSDNIDIGNSDPEDDVVIHFEDADEGRWGKPSMHTQSTNPEVASATANQELADQKPIDYTVESAGVNILGKNNGITQTNLTLVSNEVSTLDSQVNPNKAASFDVRTEYIEESPSSAEDGDTAYEMAVRMPGYPPDIPEGKRRYCSHRHRVSAMDEEQHHIMEYQLTHQSKRGPIKAIATSHVIMQPLSPGGRSGTAIVQAEATASDRSIAASRATAKAVGLASQTAAAAMTQTIGYTAGGDEELHESDNDVDVHISTSCRVGRNLHPAAHTLPAFTPRIDLPFRSTTGLRKRSDNEELRKARRDHFLSKAPLKHFGEEEEEESPFYMGDARAIEGAPPSATMTDPLKRRYWKLKSLPNDSDIYPSNSMRSSTNYRSRSTTRLHKQINGSNRMYARSGSRYRSTDIDTALASSHEQIMGTSYTDEDRKNASLFDLSGRREYGGISVNVINYPNNQSNLRFLNGKSTNSLLETNIDTGEKSGQPIILETDVDTLDTCQVVPNQDKDKSYSLFNLTNLSVPGYQRRFTGGDVVERYSRKGAYERAQSLQGIHGDNGKTDMKSLESGSRGLVARLKARARSNHELRIAESLTRLHVPEWLDKADLSKPIIPSGEASRQSSISPARERIALPRYGRRETQTSVLPIKSDAAPHRSRTVEAISKPLWSPAPKVITEENRKPLRPSQLIRERDAASSIKLMPIASKLRNSMRSIGSSDYASPIDRGPTLRTQQTANAAMARLAPVDFLTHDQKVWGDTPALHKVLSQPVHQKNGAALASAELVQGPRSPPPLIHAPTKSLKESSPVTDEILVRMNGESRQMRYERRYPPALSPGSSIQMADDDAVTELPENEFYQHDDAGLRVPYYDTGIYETVDNHKPKRPPSPTGPLSEQGKTVNGNGRIYEKKNAPQLPQVHLSSMSITPPMSPPMRAIDEDGETESQATDGLNNVSTLTCLTEMIDKYALRHLSLLQNRPSALANLLAQLGWWPTAPSSTNQRIQQSSAELIALAAGRFHSAEDGHRHEFLALLASSVGQGPVSLTEFGFDQLRIGINRNPKDGMLYLNCTGPSCPRVGPTRVDRARSWTMCTNCFTAYCSANCREEAVASHSSVCTFGRARLACGRILHQLSVGQLSSLAVLAKSGMARLGRGGILLTFASVQHAEYFYTRCNSLPNHPGAEHIIPQDNKVSADRPSPSGLMTVPLYLTAKELNDLDSRFVLPCRTYTPNNSMVVIAVVCAYDVETLANGRAVHLFKQSIILPFPTNARPPPCVDAPRLKNEVAWTESKTTKEEREVFFKRLQRTLRDRGISLRNHYKNEYQQLTRFVETGIPFQPIEFEFHDYIADQMVKCTFLPMRDAILQPQAQICASKQLQQNHSSYPRPVNEAPRKRPVYPAHAYKRTTETEL